MNGIDQWRNEEWTKDIWVLERPTGAIELREQVVRSGKKVEIADDGGHCRNERTEEIGAQHQTRVVCRIAGDKGPQHHRGQRQIERDGHVRDGLARIGRIKRGEIAEGTDHQEAGTQNQERRPEHRKTDDWEHNYRCHRQHVGGSGFTENYGTRCDRKPDERKGELVDNAIVVARAAVSKLQLSRKRWLDVDAASKLQARHVGHVMSAAGLCLRSAGPSRWRCPTR